MRQPMDKRYENEKPIGGIAFNAFFGLLVYLPIGDDKYSDCDLICCWENCETGSKWGYHKHKIDYKSCASGAIRKGNLRIKLDDIMKM